MIKSLIRIRLAALIAGMTAGRKKKDGTPAQKPSTGKLILFALLYLYLAGMIAFLFGSAFFGMATIFFGESVQLEWMYFTMMILLAFGLMFIGSVFMAKSQLFEAKDNELLLSMPIRPRDILISRMAVLLIVNFAFETVVVAPAALFWGIFGNGGLLSWVALLLTYLALPFFSLAVSGVFAWLISLLTAKIRNKSLVVTVLSLAALALYFYLIGNMDEYLNVFLERGAEIGEALRGFAPLYWIGNAISGENPLHLMFSLLIYLVPFAIACALLSAWFIRITTTPTGTGKYRAKDISTAKSASVPKTLFKKEINRFLSSPTYILNTGMPIPFAIALAVVLAVKKAAITDAVAEIGLTGFENLLGLIFAAALCLLNATADITSPSVSLEGKQLWLLRSLPVSPREILNAKLHLHLVLMIPTDLIAAAIAAVALRPSVPVVLLLFLVPPLFTVWTANIGLICNLYHHTFEWINETQPIKQGVAVPLTLLFSFLALVVLAAGGAATLLAGEWLTLVFTVGLLLIADAFSYRWLMSGGCRKWAELN